MTPELLRLPSTCGLHAVVAKNKNQRSPFFLLEGRFKFGMLVAVGRPHPMGCREAAR
jgi:hypothetical protein